MVAAGGTGGHLYPALALADVLVARGHRRSSIRFVGARGHLEAHVVPAAGYSLDLLPGRGLERRLTLANLAALADAARACAAAIRLVRRYDPAVVVGFGSYAALPTVVAARLARRPTVVHDRDAVPGLSNRIGVALGARAATSLRETRLAGATVVGNPVRTELVEITRRPSDPPVIWCSGGSQGSATINRAVVDLYDRWRDRTDVIVRLVTGPAHHDSCARRLAELRRPGDHLGFDLLGYDDDVAGSLARASVVVGRAGAGTVAELTVVGVPAVLIPLPGAPGDHQTANANALVNQGAARLVPDAECDAARLDRELSALVADRDRLDAMGARARDLGRPDAAERLADLVEEMANGGR